MELFDFNTEELIVFEKQVPDIFSPTFESTPYYNYLKENYEWIPLTDSSKYIDNDMEIKDKYTKEEIEEIKEKVLDGYKIIESAKTLEKTR